MNATLFIDPRVARTRAPSAPIPWTPGADVRAMAAYIRAWLIQQRKDQHGHR